jgi:hypothetical protein
MYVGLVLYLLVLCTPALCLFTSMRLTNLHHYLIYALSLSV